MSDRPAPAALVLLLAMALPAAAPAEPAPAPLTLRRAVELALERAPELAAAQAAAQSREAASRVAADAFRPEAYLTTNPGYGRGIPSQLPAIAGVQVHKTLYDPRRSLEGTSAQVGAVDARASAERARRDAARTAAQLYARSWTDDRLLAEAVRRQEAFARLRAGAEALQSEGRITGLELAQARLREARERLKRADLEAARDLDRMELQRLTGWPADAPLAAEEPLASLPEPAGDDLAAARAADPELRSLDATLALLGRDAGLRRRRIAPTVDAAAQYARLATYDFIRRSYRTFKADDWSVGLAIALPIWTGERIADENAQADANRTRVEEQRRARESELASQVRRAASDEARAQAAADLARQAVEVARQALQVANDLAAEGRIGPDDIAARDADLADAQEELVKASAGLAEARAGRLALRGELPSS